MGGLPAQDGSGIIFWKTSQSFPPPGGMDCRDICIPTQSTVGILRNLPDCRCGRLGPMHMHWWNIRLKLLFYIRRHRRNISACRDWLTSITGVIAAKLGVAMQGDVWGHSIDGTCGKEVPMQGRSGFDKGGVVCFDHSAWKEWGFRHGEA